MKKFIKYTVLLLQIVMVAQLSSCKKDDSGRKDCCTKKGRVVYLPVGCVGNSTVLGILDENGNYLYVKSDLTNEFSKYKENDEICFDYKETSPCNIVLPTNIMKIPLKCVILSCVSHCKDQEEECFTIDYLPSQCANTHSNVLGLRSSKGKYYMVTEDKSGNFSTYKRGDKVKAWITKVGDCIVCNACHCPSPDGCVIIDRLGPCNNVDRCKVPKEVSYYKYRIINEQQYHTIDKVYVLNGKLRFQVAISGCDGNIDPELYLTIPPLGAPFSMLTTKLKFKRAPQTCKALFIKELCFDIKPWLNAGHKSISVNFGSQHKTVNL